MKKLMRAPLEFFSHIMISVEDLDFVFKIIFAFFFWSIPSFWHSKLLPLPTLCYLKGQLPINTLGNLDLACLNNMNWGILPINSLWPNILDPSSGVQELLLDHCEDFSLKQIFWIAEHDPLNRKFLLGNSECMRQVKWAGLEVYEYRTLLPELEIQNISSFDEVDDQVVIDGLIKADFRIRSTRGLCEFLDKIPLGPLYHPVIFSNPLVSNLFNVNCFVKSKFLVKPMANILFRYPQYFSFFQMTEFLDFLQTFPQKDPNLLPAVELLLKFKQEPLPSDEASFEGTKLYFALQTRSLDYFTSTDPLSLRGKFDLGHFDQYRILEILLRSSGDSNLIIFFKLFEAKVFDDWLLLTFLENKPKIVEEIFYPADITSLSFLRFLCLKKDPRSKNISIFNGAGPLLVPQPQDIKSPEALKASLRLLTSSRFASRNFRIKFAHDAVVDMGGPLLDWITGIMQLYLDLGLFLTPNESTLKAEASLFLDPEFFKFLGMLHGKLAQINSGPSWLPAISTHIISKIESLSVLVFNPEEAVRLFNDFEFPGLDKPQPHKSHQVKDFSEVTDYRIASIRLFSDWKSRAWTEYQLGLNLFILDHVPRSFVKTLLYPSKPPTAAQIAALSTINSNDAIPHNLPDVWTSILATFTTLDLVKLLVFVTGQCSPVKLLIHFIQNPERRLPESKTCVNQLLIYTVPFTEPEVMAVHLAQSLKTSIYNYQGFGNI